MLKLAIIISSLLHLFAAEHNDLNELYLASLPPLRWSPAMISDDAVRNYLEDGCLGDRLITMVENIKNQKFQITEDQITNLIKANPQTSSPYSGSNPYSGSYKAYLIALACRYGLLNTVTAIVEHNPDSLNCNSSGCSPLDEAIEFNQNVIANYLRSKGGILLKQKQSNFFGKL